MNILFQFHIIFFEIDEMFMDLLSESSEEGSGGGGGAISLLGNEDEPIFRGYILPNQPDFWFFYSCFS